MTFSKVCSTSVAEWAQSFLVLILLSFIVELNSGVGAWQAFTTVPYLPNPTAQIEGRNYSFELEELKNQTSSSGSITLGSSSSLQVTTDRLWNKTTTTTLRATTESSQMYFISKNNTEVVCQSGTTAIMHCVAQNISQVHTVSWIRRRDYHLLTIGLRTYSSDERFSMRLNDKEQDWQLHIRYVSERDEGTYECQISTHPPVSLITRLKVTEAFSEILGGPEKFLREGSSLRLVCLFKDNTQAPSYVFWYLNQRMISYDSNVKVETSAQMSVLFLSDLKMEDSGNYTCVPSNARQTTIRIHVLKDGEKQAAIQSESDSKSSTQQSSLEIQFQAVLHVIVSSLASTLYTIILAYK